MWVKLQKANNVSNKLKTIQKPPLGNKSIQKYTSKQSNYQQPANNQLNYVEKNIVAVKNKEIMTHRFEIKSYEKLHNKHKELSEKYFVFFKKNVYFIISEKTFSNFFIALKFLKKALKK